MRIANRNSIMPPGMDPRPNPPFRIRREYDDFKGMESGATRSYRRKVYSIMPPGMDPRPNPPFRIRREYDDFKGMEPGANHYRRWHFDPVRHLRPVEANPFTLIKKNTEAALAFIPAIVVAPAPTILGLIGAESALLAFKKIRPRGDRIYIPPIVRRVAYAVTKNAWITGVAAWAMALLVVPAAAGAIALALGACTILSYLTPDPAYDL
jgi:hypothetical protein